MASARTWRRPGEYTVEKAGASAPVPPHCPDLTWLDSVDPETASHLTPTEQAILAALREYRDEVAGEGGIYGD